MKNISLLLLLNSSHRSFFIKVTISILFLLFIIFYFLYSGEGRNSEVMDIHGDVQTGVTSYTFRQQENGDGLILVAEENGNTITFRRAIELLDSFEFQNALSERIISFTERSKVGAIFFECIPVNTETYSIRPFEFILLPAPTLARRHVDSTPFQDQFSRLIPPLSENPVISFENLGKDATLVVPGPRKGLRTDLQYCTHLASFLASAEIEHRSALWRKLGSVFHQLMSQLEESNDSRPIWLSTSGLGVSWLHIRIDKIQAKYYNHLPYKSFHI